MQVSKRWLPALVVPAVIAGSILTAPIQANAVDLPDLTPQQVMLLMDRDVKGFSGTVVKTSDFGLPALEMSSMMSKDMVEEMQDKMPDGFEDFVPQLIEKNVVTQAVELMAGTHRVRIYAAEAGFRAQILDPMSQRDFIVNQNEFWVYDDRSATAQTGKIAQLDSYASKAEQDAAVALGTAKVQDLATKLQIDLSNPEAVADFLMEKVSESTSVSVGKDHMVAGRTAYQLIAEPKAANSLVKSVEISVDSETGLALELSVFSVEQEAPVFEIGFESISFATPDVSLFNFTPPAGTQVEVIEIPKEFDEAVSKLKTFDASSIDSDMSQEQLVKELEAKFAQEGAPKLIGTGWESVVYLAEIPAEVPMQMLENQLFADMLKQVDGGRVFSTPIMNVLITDSGEVYAGSVNVDYLLELAKR